MTVLPTCPSWTAPGPRAERLGWLQLIAAIPMIIAVGLVGQAVRMLLRGALGEPSRGPASLAAAVVMAVLAMTGYWCLVRLTARREVTEIGGIGALGEMGAGLAIGSLLMGAVVAVLALAGAYRVVDVGWHEGVLLGLSAGIAAGFAEEVLFRGILLRLLEDWLGTWWALGITAAIFGAGHLGNPEASAWGAVAIALEAGVLLGACYLLTRRLWLAIGVHLSWNFVQGSILGSDISGSGGGRGLIAAGFPGPEWLTGGTMGLEGSVVAVLVCAVAGVAMMLAVRRRGLVVAPLRRRRRRAAEDARPTERAR